MLRHNLFFFYFGSTPTIDIEPGNHTHPTDVSRSYGPVCPDDRAVHPEKGTETVYINAKQRQILNQTI